MSKNDDRYTIPSRCCPNRRSKKVVIGGHLVRYLCTCGSLWKASTPHWTVEGTRLLRRLKKAREAAAVQ